MDVKLGELGSWLGGRDFTPNGVISSVRRGEETCLTETSLRIINKKLFLSLKDQTSDSYSQADIRHTHFLLYISPQVVFSPPSVPGHDRYYNKYINVRKGGFGGVAILLVGYVTLSYLWEYDHISKKWFSLLI